MDMAWLDGRLQAHAQQTASHLTGVPGRACKPPRCSASRPLKLTLLAYATPLAAERLAAAREIAVDLEAHNYRSFQVRPAATVRFVLQST